MRLKYTTTKSLRKSSKKLTSCNFRSSITQRTHVYRKPLENRCWFSVQPPLNVLVVCLKRIIPAGCGPEISRPLAVAKRENTAGRHKIRTLMHWPDRKSDRRHVTYTELFLRVHIRIKAKGTLVPEANFCERVC